MVMRNTAKTREAGVPEEKLSLFDRCSSSAPSPAMVQLREVPVSAHMGSGRSPKALTMEELRAEVERLRALTSSQSAHSPQLRLQEEEEEEEEESVGGEGDSFSGCVGASRGQQPAQSHVLVRARAGTARPSSARTRWSTRSCSTPTATATRRAGGGERVGTAVREETLRNARRRSRAALTRSPPRARA